jgi:ABC-type transport system substrate-binding protein
MPSCPLMPAPGVGPHAPRQRLASAGCRRQAAGSHRSARTGRMAGDGQPAWSCSGGGCSGCARKSWWSLPIDQLGAGAKYYQHDPQEARRLLADTGFPKGFKTRLHATGGYGPGVLDAAQLIQHYLKDVGIEAELQIQEYGAYIATTAAGKFEGMAYGPVIIAWEPDSVLGGLYTPDQLRNSGHVNDPKLTAMLKEQRRTPDVEARKRIIFDMQRYLAEQQYYVYTNSSMVTASWQPYVKNYGPNPTWHIGSQAAALWLER